MKSLLVKIAIVIAGAVAIALVIWVGIEQRRAYLRDAIVSLGNPFAWSPTGREANFSIGGNEYDKTRIVLIEHHDAIAPDWNKIDPRTSWSSNDPIFGLLSNVAVVTSYPPDPSKSGLWVDGKKVELDEHVHVVFVSERLPATRVQLTPAEEIEFLRELENMGGSDHVFPFIDKWIIPRLPEAPPAPTVDEIIRRLKG
jgi:hypothetical protein